jgi:hypothetical protein
MIIPDGDIIIHFYVIVIEAYFAFVINVAIA